jgi:ankyrin repeat protein
LLCLINKQADKSENKLYKKYNGVPMKIVLLTISLFTLSINCMERQIPTLFTAIDSNNIDQVYPFIENGDVDINAKNNNNDTPLHHAIKHTISCDIIDLLLSKRALINNHTSSGELSLHLAAKTTTSAVLINLLIQAKSEINALDKDGYTPLAHALANNKYLVINALIRANGEVSPLGVAVTEKTTTETETETVTPKASQVSAHDTTRRTADRLKRFYSNSTLVATSAPAIQLQENSTHSYSSDTSSAEQPTNKKRRTNNKKELNPLHAMVLKGKVNFVKILIEENCDINTKDIDGKAPLHLAMENNNKEIIRLLINANTNVNLKDSQGFSYLHYAVSKLKDPETIDMLINAKADVNATDAGGFTALHHAVSKSYDNTIVQLLINAGADLNAQAKDSGFTALACAQEQYNRTGNVFFQEAINILKAAHHNKIVDASVPEDTDNDEMILDEEIL